ncbi:MAG: YhgE/Pip domain-containing protein [Lachnospiraceae bacterium]|nr:YhgE/Pip domain-containing protein [Lachnospiraceae bacterium]
MLKSELKSLWKNKLLLVVVVAIILIPSIYAGLFLSSMWDPYGDLEYLPVAVVNKDEPVEYNGKELAVGESLAENLEDNDSMAFNLVDEDVAMKGLKNGTYYMVITIPENFSKNATTVMDDDPEQMKLEYTTNPGKNYISMKLSESAMKTIQSNITEEVTRTYAENVFDSLTDVEDGFNDAVDGTQEMLDGEDQLTDGNDLITENLLVLADGAKTLRDGTKTLSNGANTLNNSMGQLTSGAGELASGVSQYTGGVGQLADGINTLKNGTATLAGNVPTLTKGVSDLKNGSDQLTAGYEGDKGAVKGAATLAEGLTQVNQAVQGISLPSANLTEEQKNQIASQAAATVTSQEDAIKAQAESAVDAKKSDIMSAATSAAQAQVGATTTEQQAALIAAGKSEGAKNIAQLQSGVDQLITGAAGSAAASTANTVATSAAKETVGAVVAQLNEIAQQYGDDTVRNAATAIGDASDAIASQVVATVNAGVDANTIGAEALNTAKSDPGYTAVHDGISNAVGGYYAEGYGAGTVANAGTIAYNAVRQAAGDIAVSAAQSAAGSGAIAGAQGVATEVSTQLGSFGTQLDTLKAATQSLETGSKQLSGGINQLYAGTKQVNTGLTTLNNSAGTLATGVNQLDNGAGSLMAGVSQLAGNSGKLNAGAGSLAAGTLQVADAVSQIADGSGQLDDGAVQIEDGAVQLHDGSKELGDGLSDLKDGTITLHDALADGADEVASNEASDKNLDMFSNPVEIEEEKLTEVENNGHGMAAYMMSVGLWVGCLAFCLMYPLTKYHGNFKNGFEWWFSKAAVAAPVGLCMVLVLMLIMSAFLGFTPGSMLKTIIVGLAAVTAFMCIQYFFDILFGKVGSFLMLIFMVLQLTGSAGTYPIEISGHLAQSLHDWMPFTYSVNGFRAAIASGQTVGITKEVAVLAGIAVVFTILTIIVFEIRGCLIRQNKKMVYDWIEEKGLA